MRNILKFTMFIPNITPKKNAGRSDAGCVFVEFLQSKRTYSDNLFIFRRMCGADA